MCVQLHVCATGVCHRGITAAAHRAVRAVGVTVSADELAEDCTSTVTGVRYRGGATTGHCAVRACAVERVARQPEQDDHRVSRGEVMLRNCPLSYPRMYKEPRSAVRAAGLESVAGQRQNKTTIECHEVSFCLLRPDLRDAFLVAQIAARPAVWSAASQPEQGQKVPPQGKVCCTAAACARKSCNMQQNDLLRSTPAASACGMRGSAGCSTGTSRRHRCSICTHLLHCQC